jgi:BASS family bile acid:Na+ symporter
MNPMTEGHLNTLGNLLVVLFVVTNMLSLGMSMSIKEIVAPLRDVALTLKALIANFVLVPLGAYLLARLLQLEHEATIGFILIATAAGEPFVTKLGQLSKADPAYILALLVMLQVVSVVYMPVTLPLLLPGVTVSPWDIAKPLIFLMLVPLAIGLGVKATREKVARLLCSPLDRVSSFFVAAAIVLILTLRFQSMMATWGSHMILAALLLGWWGFACGYFLGGPQPANKATLALATGMRGGSAALVVGVSNFPTAPNVVLMILMVLLFGMLTMAPLAATVLRRKNIRNHSTAVEQ